jgi:hypothetical protein
MDKRAIARIVVGNVRGTGFLVSRQGQVLTALHVVADLEGSVRNERLKAYADPIWLTFGDPVTKNTWAPAGPASIVPELYSLKGDWVVLQFPGPVPDDVAPLTLADLGTALDGVVWNTFGFPDVAAHDGGDFDGPITSWEPPIARLRSDAATGVKMRGISGAPCIVNGDIVALIGSALLDDELCQGGVLLAIQVREIVAAAGGRLPFSKPVDVPFERRVRSLLPDDDPDALRDAAKLLGIPDRPFHGDVARGVILAGVELAAQVLWAMAVSSPERQEVIDMVAAAQLHHEAVDKLVEAVRTSRPGVLRASAEETCNWYGLRARHKLTLGGDPAAAPGRAAGMWGKRLLHVNVAGLEETAAPAAPAAPAAREVDPIAVAADQLIALIRQAATRQWVQPRAVQDALAGKPGAPFCVALHGEHRVPVVEALRVRLPNARFLMVCPDDVVVGDAERDRVMTIAPHLQDEAGLLLAYDTVRTAD